MSIIIFALVFILGILVVASLFTQFSAKRVLRKVPHSTIGSLATGLVELKGTAKRIKIIQAPLSKTECVFFRYTVEHYKKAPDSSGHTSDSWVYLAGGDSGNCPFSLDDGTGTITVLPQGAEVLIPVSYSFESTSAQNLPGKLIDFMKDNGLKDEGRPVRFREYIIKPGQTIFILGTVNRNGYSSGDHKGNLIQRLDVLRQDARKMAGVDLNKDGRISVDEWDAVVAKIERELLEDELKSTSQIEIADAVIGQGDAQKLFIISDKSQT